MILHVGNNEIYKDDNYISDGSNLINIVPKIIIWKVMMYVEFWGTLERGAVESLAWYHMLILSEMVFLTVSDLNLV